MDKLSGLRAFVEVAHSGSFTEAGTTLSMGSSAVSKRVAAVEDWLGVRLLQRTTHGVALTDDGRTCLSIASQVLEGIDALEQESASRQSEPTGKVRISMPYAMGQIYVIPRLAMLLDAHPRLQLDIHYTDDVPDLIDQSLDIAVRIGAPNDSRVVARKLAHSRRVTCATPGYLSRRAAINDVADLASHNCIGLYRNGRPRKWQFEQNGVVQELLPSGNLYVHSGIALREAVLAGIGLVQCNSILVEPELRSGALVEVLNGFALPSESLYSIFLQNRQMVPRVRATINFLEQCFGEYRGTEHATQA